MDPVLLATAVAVTSASTLHRISGMGFGLVAIPVLVLAFGPIDGVRVGFALGLTVSLLALVNTWRHVAPGPTTLLCLPAVVTVPLGAYVARMLSEAMLLVLIGSLLVGGLALAPRLRRLRTLTGGRGATITGGAAGFVHVTSGLSVPVLAVYAVSDGWDLRSFAASAQVVFIVLNLGSIAVGGMSDRVWSLATVLVIPVLVGMFLGGLTARVVSADAARLITLTVAWLSAGGAVGRGILQLLS